MPPTQAPPTRPPAERPSQPPAERSSGRPASAAGRAIVAARRPLGARPVLPGRRGVSDRGSQTMEYALILIVAATIAMLALTWARQGAVKALLDAVMHKVTTMFEIGKG